MHNVFTRKKLSTSELYFRNLEKKANDEHTKKHCVKSVRIWSYSGPHFPTFGLNNSKYGYFSRSARKTILKIKEDWINLVYSYFQRGEGRNLFENLLIVNSGKKSSQYQTVKKLTHTAWKVSVFRVFLVRIIPHSDWIRRLSVCIQSECGKIPVV